jgi:hypothetical protein
MQNSAGSCGPLKTPRFDLVDASSLLLQGCSNGLNKVRYAHYRAQKVNNSLVGKLYRCFLRVHLAVTPFARKAMLRRAGQRALRCHNCERYLDERRVAFAAGRIYSTVGYADAALA